MAEKPALSCDAPRGNSDFPSLIFPPRFCPSPSVRMKTFQASRYELKYLVSEKLADSIRAEVLTHLNSDQNSVAGSQGYRVQSLYLDSPRLHCYQDTLQGNKNRFKLRIRFYDNGEHSPVFLEIKRRVTDVIQKKRACVSRESAEKLLKGYSPNPQMLINNTPAEQDGLNTFFRLKEQLGATGRIYVDYYREAYQNGSDNDYRVTFDRQICGSHYRPGSRLIMPEISKMSKIDNVVLEMKFINQPAPWMIAIAQRFGLTPTSVPKYVECINALKLNQGSVAGVIHG